ncbi:MAG: thioredoxin family protein [Anaerolineales bacterium]|nr:thioredoxin family protein [Anaerolineales bacterium]
MLERMVITLVILGGLGLFWLGWRYYKLKLTQSIQPAETAPGIPTLLFFCADYCAPCKLQQQPVVDSLAAKFGESLAVRRYDVTEHPALASRYKVLTLPTTVVLNGQGYVAHINYGVASQAKLEAQLAPHQAENTSQGHSPFPAMAQHNCNS